MNNGILTISLDFELHWGGFDKWVLENYREYFLNTRQVIPEVLSLFEKYGIHATWATVGMLLHNSKTSLLNASPTIKPSYDRSDLSAYKFIEGDGIGESEEEDPFHFADTLVRQITNIPFQELGSHTFAHYYCNEPGQTVEQFRADLQAARASSIKYGKKLRSLVFPRNQYNEEYLRACYDEGFIAVRANPRDWFWNIQSTQHESKWKRLCRGMDAYLPIGKKNSYKLKSLHHHPGLPISIPASRLLRPYNPKELFLNDVKLARINSEMRRSASKGEIYHLWWHPHNFGHHPQESLRGLKNILDNFSKCKNRYGLRSLNMGEVAEQILNKY